MLSFRSLPRVGRGSVSQMFPLTCSMDPYGFVQTQRVPLYEGCKKHDNRYCICLLATQLSDVGLQIPHRSPVQSEIFPWFDPVIKKSYSLPQYGFNERVQ